MTTVSSKYEELLHNSGFEGVAAKQGKYFKTLINKHLSEVMFVQPPCGNTTEILIMSYSLGALPHDTDTDDVANVTAVCLMLRKELRTSL